VPAKATVIVPAESELPKEEILYPTNQVNKRNKLLLQQIILIQKNMNHFVL